jgi:hypothetical protein
VSTFKKPALVLVISGLLFAGMVYLLDFEPLDFVRTHFYNPSFVRSIVKENEKAAEIVQSHILELQNKFAATLNEPAVKSSFLYNQTAADIYERSKVFGILMESVSGLQSVQFVDSNGVRIHYSTSNRDLISQSSNSASYRNYTDDNRALPYDDISAGASGNPKYTMDDSHDRIIFSFPFYDSMNVYRGTAIFTISVRALAERLITQGSLKPTDDISVIRKPRGVVFGSPNTSKSVILDKIASVWSADPQDYVSIDADDAGVKYALISTKTGSDLFFGRIVNDSIFSVSDSMKLILQLSMFLTLFLTLYFIINFKPHPVTLVKNRIKTLRTNLFEQLYIKETGQDRAKWILELEQRRDEIRFELKSRIRIKHSLENKINDIIDKAWDELLAVMKSGYDPASLEEIVKNRAVKIEKTKPEEKVSAGDEIDRIEEIDKIEDLEEIEEVESLEETEEIAEEIEEAEALEEVESIEEAEALEEIDEIIDEIEEVEEIEELEETLDSGIDEIGETSVSEAEDIDEIEEINEVDGVTPAETTSVEATSIVPSEEDKPYTEILLSKGLLKAANEILVKIKKEDKKISPRTVKGLLKRAIDFLDNKEASAPIRREGLLRLAIEFLNSLDGKTSNNNTEKPFGKGLLAQASYFKEESQEPVALSADNLSVREVEENAEADDGGQGALPEMEVVSPFSDMFSSFDNGKDI